jgi:p-hydroxybenzoate 3-monooxygenase
MQTIANTTVGIVGGGPAGLMLSHLLSIAGIESVVVDHRTRTEIVNTVRAGILEADSVKLLVESGVSDRVHRDGIAHDGIDLRFGGENHRIDFAGLVGERSWLYQQTEVFTDLADARERDGGDVRFGISNARIADVDSDRPGIVFTDAAGHQSEIRCDYLVGADGSRSICRAQIPEAVRTHYFREYPFAWFGILTQAPKSVPELVYTHSPRGFALISQRSDTLQRMYFQCDPDEDTGAWSADRIWAELQARVAGPDGFTLAEGPITDTAVLRFRSFVAEPMRHGRLLLAGDAAHTVPPTGAKGLNLAVADVAILAPRLVDFCRHGDTSGLDDYSQTALRRVWRAQDFSNDMSLMMHTNDDPFEDRRQQAKLRYVVSSEAAQRSLAENYVGLRLS